MHDGQRTTASMDAGALGLGLRLRRQHAAPDDQRDGEDDERERDPHPEGPALPSVQAL